MEILVVTPETYPFVRGGSLADVTGALPKALRALGHKVTVLSVLFRNMDPSAHAFARRLTRLSVPFGDQTIPVEVYESRLPSGVQVTLLNAPGITDADPAALTGLDALRFATVLSRGAVEWVRAQNRPTDIIHTFDWTTGLVPLFVKSLALTEPKLAATRTVLSLHDPDAQGWVDAQQLPLLHLPSSLAMADNLGRDGRISLLRAAILHADRVTAVSTTWGRMFTSSNGHALPPLTGTVEAAIRSRGRDLAGINHGVDYAVWNPTTDPHIAARYDAMDPAGRVRCRADLVASLGLSMRPSAALMGFVGSIDSRSGADLLLDIAPRIVRQDTQLVVLGRPGGDPLLVERMNELARAFPDRVSFKHEMNEPLAHKIFAGVDLMLCLARGDVSGMSHLYAMRYGAVPISRVSPVVRDAVVDCDTRLETGLGFLFSRAEPEELLGAIGRAIAALRNPEGFVRLRRRAMVRDASWERSGRLYQGIYSSLQTRVSEPVAG